MDNIITISINDKNYPKSLKASANPPKELYAIGDVSLLNQPAIAIIGTRRPSIYGAKQAEKFAYELAKSGFVIVSGMARGIDSVAHKGALTANGKTIAVLGCGVDICYPPEHSQLKSLIEKNGLVISPFPLGTAPLPGQFPSRNSIVSGISKGVLVIECAEKSGTFSTVAAAKKQNVPVWTIPTNLDNISGKGNIILIKKGVNIATSPKDIFDILGMKTSKESIQLPSDICQLTSDFHPSQPITIETLMSKWNLNIAETNNKLLELELEGKIKSLPNKTYILA